MAIINMIAFTRVNPITFVSIIVAKVIEIGVISYRNYSSLRFRPESYPNRAQVNLLGLILPVLTFQI